MLSVYRKTSNITDISAYFFTPSDTFPYDKISIFVRLFVTPFPASPNENFVYATPPFILTPKLAVNTPVFTTVTGLAIPVIAGTRLLLLFYAEDSDGGVNEITGIASAGVFFN